MGNTLYVIYWRDSTKGTSGNGTTGLPYVKAKEIIDNLNHEYPNVHNWLQISPIDTRQCYYIGCLSRLDSISPPQLFQCTACDNLYCQNCSNDHMTTCKATYRIAPMKMVRDHSHIEYPDRIT